jgi:hypothetical protein
MENINELINNLIYDDDFIEIKKLVNPNQIVSYETLLSNLQK